MAARKPQINFQVQPEMKMVYDELKAHGHRVTRLCAAGLLLMVEEPHLRFHAVTRLRDWETQYADASSGRIRVFIQETQSRGRCVGPA